MSTLFILNANGVFFTVDATNVDVNTNFIADNGCKLFNSINELYEGVSVANDIDIDEIDGVELQIYHKDGDIVCYDPTADNLTSVDHNVENFIIDYEV